MATTPRRSWNIPSTSSDDPTVWYAAWVALQADTDADMPFSSGLWANRPSPALVGQVYRATDALGGEAVFMWTGVGSGDARWKLVYPSVLRGVAASRPTQQVYLEGLRYVASDWGVEFQVVAGVWVAVGIANPPGFSAKPSSSQSISALPTYAKVAFGTEEWDDAGWFDASQSRFTPLVAGRYLFNATITMTSGGTQVLAMAIAKNGTEVRSLQPAAWGETATARLGASGLVEIDANGSTDYFELFAASAGGSAAVNADTGVVGTQFQGRLVRLA